MISRIDWNQTLKLSPESGPTNAKTANGSAASSSCDEPDGRDGRPGKQAFGIKTAAHVGETGPEEVARLRLWIRRRWSAGTTPVLVTLTRSPQCLVCLPSDALQATMA